ncbi:putative bifunctional diguanylate cyclase/phosphodiesterase [Paludibacterium yongneupense]|uniref:putative bifunctional diguanylate cyclase/phosphodiesterase n=1 Tax=Paludibacterium yongneupense TaxID=400061 RepID=UPI0003F5DCE1|nr:EAL domain-containing protein [Paludibacterium yongneupense]
MLSPESSPVLHRLLRAADTLLLGLLDNTQIGVYVIQDSRFLYANQRLAQQFGYAQQDLCALTPAPELLDEAGLDPLPQGENARSSGAVTFRAVRKDGSAFDAKVIRIRSSFEQRPALIGMLLDVSERRRAERAVADQLHFIAQLVEAIPNAMYYKDRAGRFLGCNAAYEQLIGKNRSELIGHSNPDAGHDDQSAAVDDPDAALCQHPGHSCSEVALAHADGSYHDVIVYKATFNEANGHAAGMVGLILDISERKRAEETIWREANYDALTGLPNSRMLRDRLQEDIKRAQRNGQPLAVLFIDLDHFKEVNDSLGHGCGDMLLTQAAQRIREALRATDTVARKGGDEFIVILPSILSPSMVEQVAQDIRHALSLPFTLAGHPAHISASIGIALYPDDGSDSEDLLSCADQAMYVAKSRGRNGACSYTSSMHEQASSRHVIGNDLHQALFDGQLDVHYQPIIELAGRRMVKAEALIRWQHPRHGSMEPSEFIPIAENMGIIGDMGDWIFMQAIDTAFRCQAAVGTPPPSGAGNRIPISINVSRQQLVAGRCAHWPTLLGEAGLPRGAIAVEITEGLLLDPRPSVVETLQAFRDAGIAVSLDDFGTSYSALSGLRKFAIEAVKIDRSFVSELGRDPDALAIASGVIAMAHHLGIKAVAEGVETEEQCRLLQQARCDFAQGYLFAEPMRQNEFLHYILQALPHPGSG